MKTFTVYTSSNYKRIIPMTSVTRRISCLTLGLVLAGFGSSMTTRADTPTNSVSKLDSLLGDPVIARGKGVEIKRSQLDSEMIQLQAAANAQGRPIPPDNLGMFQLQKLNDLIAAQLLLARATDADKARGRELFAKALQRLKADNKLTDAEFDEKLGSQLRLQGLTRAEWDRQRVEQATVAAVLQRELEVNITDADAKKYYEENPTRFEQPEQVRASHILLSTKDPVTGEDLSEEQKKAKRKQLEEVRKQAVDGADFAALARQYSEDPGSKDRGGEYTFKREDMVPEFSAAAFSLRTNQVSDVVTTAYGYHIIKLGEKIPARMLPYAEVADDLKEVLRSQALQKKLADGKFIEALRKEAHVEILDERLKKIEELMASSQQEQPAAGPK